jgi:hypothetical protein
LHDIVFAGDTNQKQVIQILGDPELRVAFDNVSGLASEILGSDAFQPIETILSHVQQACGITGIFSAQWAKIYIPGLDIYEDGALKQRVSLCKTGLHSYLERKEHSGLSEAEYLRLHYPIQQEDIIQFLSGLDLHAWYGTQSSSAKFKFAGLALGYALYSIDFENRVVLPLLRHSKSARDLLDLAQDNMSGIPFCTHLVKYKEILAEPVLPIPPRAPQTVLGQAALPMDLLVADTNQDQMPGGSEQVNLDQLPEPAKSSAPSQSQPDHSSRAQVATQGGPRRRRFPLPPKPQLPNAAQPSAPLPPLVLTTVQPTQPLPPPPAPVPAPPPASPPLAPRFPPINDHTFLDKIITTKDIVTKLPRPVATTLALPCELLHNLYAQTIALRGTKLAPKMPEALEATISNLAERAKGTVLQLDVVRRVFLKDLLVKVEAEMKTGPESMICTFGPTIEMMKVGCIVILFCSLS